MTAERPRRGQARPSENVFDGLAERMNRHVGDLVLVNAVVATTTLWLALPLDGVLYLWAGVTAVAALGLGLINLFATRGTKAIEFGKQTPAAVYRSEKRFDRLLATACILGLGTWLFRPNAAAFALAVATALLITVWIWVLRVPPPPSPDEGRDPREEVPNE